MRKLTLLITALFLSVGMAWAQTNANGSLVTFTNVQKNGAEAVLYITDDGVLDFSTESAAELGEAAQFRATKQSDGTWTFYNETKELYMIWRGNSGGHDGNDGLLAEYSAEWCNWTVEKSTNLPGGFFFHAKRGDRNENGTLVKMANGSFDKYSGEEGWSNTYSNVYRIDVTFGFEAAKDYASINKWYYLTFRPDWNRKLYYDGTSNVLDATKTTIDATDKDAYSWAFIGNPFDGYKVVNKKAGEGKYLNAADGGAIVGTAEHVFTLTESSHATNGFFMAGNGKKRFNLQGGKVKYWDNADVGSTFVVTLRDDAAELQASIDNAKATLQNLGEGTTVGYVTADSKNNISDAISDAETAIQNGSGYDAAEAALKAAVSSVNTIQPEVGKYYTINSEFYKNDGTGEPIGLDVNVNKLIFNRNFNVSKWFQFVDAGNGQFYLYNVKSGLYLSSNGGHNSGQVSANATTTADAKAVTITNMGNGNIVKIVPVGGAMIHAQAGGNVVAWDNEEYTSASAWTIVEVENPGVAYIDNTNYATLAEAVAAWQEGQTINLLANTDETVVLPKGMKLDVINFNAFTAPNVKEAVAKIGETGYLTLEAAVAAAQADDEVVVVADVADVVVDIDKNLTISGAATLNNVGINANGADALTVKGLDFTGNSWINSGTAEALTISGITANVAPVNTSYTNSRSAFISLGKVEAQQLALTVEDSKITVTSQGPDAILGWAAITEATIKNNVLKGSSDGYFTNADAVKFMSIADGAEFDISGNEIYSNYNGIVFAQNTTRDNAYSVEAAGNKFVGEADHIWIEVTGGDVTHATFNAASDNTVNGNAITANDIKYHSGVIKSWSSYAGIDVVTDADGKVIGGTLASFSNEESLADGFVFNDNGDGTYGVQFASYIVLPDGVNSSNYAAKFGDNTVTDGTNYYVTLQAAVEAVAGQANAVLYCKPGADVGSLQHAPVTNTLTVYGNGADVTGNTERDFDIGNTDPSGGNDITADMTLTVKHLNGCGAWGAKATEHTVNLVFENCANMGKVLISGTTGTLNITMTDCAFEGVIKEAVYSNADGAITLTNVAFSNLNKAVNLNHKAAGTQTVTINGCTFTDCGADVAADQIPVRVLSSVEGGKSVLTVTGSTFTGTPEGGADILLDYGVGHTTASVSGTAANVVVKKENNVGTTTAVKAEETVEFTTALPVAQIGEDTFYTFAEAAAAAQAGDEIKLLSNIEGDITVPANVTLNGNDFAISGGILAAGEITFDGVTKAASFNVENTNTVVNIPAGASLQLTGTGRMVIGHGCTFNITGSIADNAAKTTDKATLTPSLVMPGASFTGAGVTFNVTNAYISAPSSYCSSSKSASGTFDFNFTNSIWESAGKLAFESQSTAATVNFGLKNSVLNTGSHLLFSTASGDEGVVIDNSLVNVGTQRQLENCGTMTIKNGSVVNGAVATSSNAKNPGTLIVENATYAVTGEFSGSDLGTGTIIIKKGANVSVGSIKDGANVTVDAEGMTAGDVINFTADLSQFTGTLSVINNDKLEAQIVDGKIVLATKPVAKIGEQGYATLEAAVAAVQDGETITILAGTHSEGTIKLPATLNNVTIKGAEGAELKDMTISAADGNAYSYVGLTFDGITFDNSRILLTGWRNGEETIENLTVTNCTFKNLNDNTNTAPVHINKDASKAVKNFTFTNNVIDGATGGQKSGIYAQVTGNVVVENNVINNVSFRPYVIQVTTDDGIADNFTVKGNTFSGSAGGRAQGLGNNAEGTDNVNLVVSNNIFKGITEAQQICYWNFNPETTTADLSKNYYDIDIVANPSKIYFNGSAEDNYALRDMNVFPIYTALNEDGTINTESAFTPKFYIAQVGENSYETLSEAVAAAQVGETVTLIANVELSTTQNISKSITIDGNGNTITTAESVATNNHAAFYIDGESTLDVTIKNATFDGVNGCAVRSLDANVTIDNCVFQNGTNTGIQGLVRLTQGNATVKNSKFLNNTCPMVLSFNYDAGNGADVLVVDNCQFEGNKASTTAVLYYVKGAKCTIKDSEFIENTLNCSSNGATIYLGFTENNVVTGNLFENNTVIDASTSTRVAGAIFFGYEAEVSGNAFVNNTASNANGDVLGQVCTSTYYDCTIDLGGNYWGGNAPAYGADYTVQHQTGEGTFALNSYYTVCGTDENGNVVLSDEVEIKNVAKVGKFGYASLQAAVEAAQAGETVTMLADVELTESLVIAAGKEVVLDLNGKTVTMVYTAKATKNHTMVSNSGNLTIESSVEGGKLSYTYAGENIGTTCSTNTVTSNPGSVLTVKSGTIENLTYDNSVIAYAIDGLTNGGAGDVTVNIEGGVITSKRQAVRIFANSTTNTGALNISGGDITGRVIVQNSNASANKAALNITGGTFNANAYKSDVLYVGGSNSAAIDIDATVSGGTFKGEITETNVTGFITGGTFANDVTDYCADGYLCEANIDGTYGVVVDPAYGKVAKIGDTYYATVAEAVAAAQAGETVVVLENVEVASGTTITLDGVNLSTLDGVTLTNNGAVNVKGEVSLNIVALAGEELNLLDGAIVKNSTVGGNAFVAGGVTFRGANTFAMLYDFGTLTDYYGTTAPMKWIVEEGASVTLTDKARYGLGYGDNVTVNGNIENALAARETVTEADRSLFVHGLVAQESKGWNCNSAMTVKDAYVVIGSNNSFGNKPGNYGGTYTFNFENSVVDASRITFYEALSTTTFTFDGCDVKMGTFMTRDADSKFTLKNSKVLSTTTFNGNDEGNYNKGELTLVNSSLTYSAELKHEAGVINLDCNSVLTAPAISGAGKITVDATGLEGTVTVINGNMANFAGTIEIVGNEYASYSITTEGLVINSSFVAELVINDANAENYTNDTEKTVGTLTYKRTLPRVNTWVALYVPFSIPMSELIDNYDIAYFNDVHGFDDNEDNIVERTTIELIKVTNRNAVLKANYPLLIRAKSEAALNLELTLTDAKLCKSEEKSVSCKSLFYTYEIKGTYSRMTSISDNQRVLGINPVTDNAEWGTLATGYSLNPYRLILTITPRENVDLPFESIRMRVIGEDGEDGTTTIYEVESENGGEDMIFDLQGRRVLEPQKGGMYIINGKKVLY